MARKLLLKHRFGLGDSILLTALARDIHRLHPGKYDVLIDAHFREVFAHNPFCRNATTAELRSAPAPIIVPIVYRPGIKAAGHGQKVHMLSWFHRDFTSKTGVEVYPTEPKAAPHLLPVELEPLVPGRYWLMLAGGKTDVTVKWWMPARWQEVVDGLTAQNIRVVQAGGKFNGHKHNHLNGTLDLVGKYPSARQFMNLVYHADGVICPITAAMHLAACYDKPCVVIAGGREEPWWEGYTNAYKAFGPRCSPVQVEHQYLHTLGLLDCCKAKGCWKHRTVALRDRQPWDEMSRRCKRPLAAEGETFAECMGKITSGHVLDAVMGYYRSGQLPAVGEAKKVISLPQTRETLPVNVSPAANMPTQQDLAPEVVSKKDLQTIEHPLIGGRLTVCVLCYGDHHELHRACLTSIAASLLRYRYELRIGLNAVCQQTKDYLAKEFPDALLYDHPENAKKYPVMREMLHDPRRPLTTKYVVWFDDDAKVVNPNMWSKLCAAIVANHPTGARLFGWHMVHDTTLFAKPGHDPTKWFKAAVWWRNRHLKVRGRGAEAPNGSVVDFVAGWFWAIAAETIKAGDIPCPRLNHNGGDITIGEQVHQAGGKIKTFNVQKELVWCPSKENGGRRGYQERFPWAKP